MQDHYIGKGEVYDCPLTSTQADGDKADNHQRPQLVGSGDCAVRLVDHKSDLEN